MTQNSILLQNVSPEELKQIISEAVEEKFIKLQLQKKEETKYYTRKQVKELLNISYPTLRVYTRLGKLKGYRIGGRVLYKADEIEQSLNKVQTLKFQIG